MKTVSTETGRKTGLAWRLALFITAGTALIFCAALAFNYIHSRRLIEQQIRNNVEDYTRATVERLEKELVSVETATRMVARRSLWLEHDEAELDALITDTLHTVSNMYGMTIAYDPEVFREEDVYCAPYHFRSGDGFSRVMLDGNNINYFYRDWYLIPRVLEKACWTEPYYSKLVGGVLMATFSQPIFQEENGTRTFVGIVASDVLLARFREIVNEVHILSSGSAILLSETGVYITNPDSERVMRESIFDTAEEIGSTALRSAGRDMIRGGSGFVQLEEGQYRDVDALIYYAPVGRTGWSLVLVLPQAEVYSELNVLNRKVGAIALGGFVLLTLMGMLMGRFFAQPVVQVTCLAELLAAGNMGEAQRMLEAYRVQADRLGTAEYSRLAQAFIKMTEKLITLLASAKDAASRVSTSSVQIAASARSLQETGESQAASTTEVYATSRIISDNISALAERMNGLKAEAAASVDLADSGKSALMKISSAQQHMMKGMDEFARQLDAITDRTRDIGQIIITITQVANQTNLLSLNAAIEAEKAGVHGRGFAVVARQIRALADQTSVAVLNIEETITEVQLSIENSVYSMKQVRNLLQDGSEEIAVLSGDIGVLIEQSRAMGPEFVQANTEMQQQEESAGQISQAIEMVKQSAMQTRDALAEFQSVADELNRAAVDLDREMAHFKE